MNVLAVESIGIIAPGLPNWVESRATLAGEQPYVAGSIPAATATLLPANERRRATMTIKWALHAAQEAMAQTHIDAQTVRTVFASSGGDSEIVDKICVALTQLERPVSPTHFHQSVHNTPAGYWTIATGCMQASNSLSAYDDSFAAGLLEAAALAWTDAAPVLLVAYDVPPPFPLSERRILVAPFAVALLLNPTPTARRQAVLRLKWQNSVSADRLADAELERLRLGNPAARSLPLLCAIAQRAARSVILSASTDAGLRVEIEP